MNDNDRAAMGIKQRNDIGNAIYGQLRSTPDEIKRPSIADLSEAVIIHLWKQSDDWDCVQRAVAVMLEDEVRCNVAPNSYHGKLEDMAAEITAAIMTALLGPRPEGGTDER